MSSDGWARRGSKLCVESRGAPDASTTRTRQPAPPSAAAASAATASNVPPGCLPSVSQYSNSGGMYCVSFAEMRWGVEALVETDLAHCGGGGGCELWRLGKQLQSESDGRMRYHVGEAHRRA